MINTEKGESSNPPRKGKEKIPPLDTKTQKAAEGRSQPGLNLGNTNPLDVKKRINSSNSGDPSPKIAKIFTESLTVGSPETKSANDLEVSQQKSDAPTPDFLTATVNRNDFTAHIFNQDPYYSFTLTTNGKDFLLKGAGVRPDDGEFIGTGAFSRTFLAENIAVKVLELGELNTPERLAKEAKFLKKLEGSKNVISSTQIAVTQHHMFIFMNRIHGRDLFDTIPHLTFERKILILLDIAHGLEELHNMGIIHRDLKPDNVLVDDHGAIIIDLGLAAEISEEIKEQSGSLLYACPEALKGEKQGTASDVYSFAILMYAVLVGRNIDFIGEGDPALHYKSLVERTKQDMSIDPSDYQIDEIPLAQQEIVENMLRDCLKLEPAARSPLEEVTSKLQSISDSIKNTQST